MNESFKVELARLAARVDKLERGQSIGVAQQSPVEDERYWLVEKMKREGAENGAVAYGGAVTLSTGEQYIWQKQAGVQELLKRDWQSLDRVLAALGHPVRLGLLKALLEGRCHKADLEQLEGLGTSGQLYHHLKALEESGWIRSLERGVYGVPGERVIPLLAILTAAMG